MSAIALGAGERVGAVDIHGAGAANAFAAGAAESQRAVDVVLDMDKRVQNHRPAFVEIDRIFIRCADFRRRPATSDRRLNVFGCLAPSGAGYFLPRLTLEFLGRVM